jgi:glucokinase
VVIAGGLGLRLKDHLLSRLRPAFHRQGPVPVADGVDPGRFITHPQPGLYGAAAVFAQEHTQ